MKKESCSSLNRTWYGHAKEEKTQVGELLRHAACSTAESTTMTTTMTAITMTITTTTMAMVRVSGNNNRDNNNNATINWR